MQLYLHLNSSSMHLRVAKGNLNWACMLFWLFFTLSPNERNRQAGNPCQITSRHYLLGSVQIKSNSGTDPYVMALSVCIATKLCFVDVMIFLVWERTKFTMQWHKGFSCTQEYCMFSGVFLLMHNEWNQELFLCPYYGVSQTLI